MWSVTCSKVLIHGKCVQIVFIWTLSDNYGNTEIEDEGATGGADYANRKQIERLGAEKALEHQLFSLAAKYKLRPVPYPEWLRHSPGTPLPFTGAASSSVAPVDCPEQWS